MEGWVVGHLGIIPESWCCSPGSAWEWHISYLILLCKLKANTEAIRFAILKPSDQCSAPIPCFQSPLYSISMTPNPFIGFCLAFFLPWNWSAVLCLPILVICTILYRSQDTISITSIYSYSQPWYHCITQPICTNHPDWSRFTTWLTIWALIGSKGSV